jgi:tetratricopeptide (TPR) repeat protein
MHHSIRIISFTLFTLLLLSGCTTLKTRKNVSIDYYNLGREYYDLKKYDKSIAAYEKSLDYNPSEMKTVINLIMSYQMNKDYAKAESLITRYYKPVNNETNKKLLKLLGNNFFYQANFQKALQTYELYSKTYDTDPEGFFNQGLCYLKLNDKPNALKSFLQSFNRNDQFIPAVYNLASYYFNEKDFENSMIYYRKLITLDANNPDVFYKLGILEIKIKEYEIAADHLKNAAKIDPKNPDYYIELAKVYAAGFNQRDKTLYYLEEALKNGFKDDKAIKTAEEFKLLNEFKEFKDLLQKYFK